MMTDRQVSAGWLRSGSVMRNRVGGVLLTVAALAGLLLAGRFAVSSFRTSQPRHTLLETISTPLPVTAGSSLDLARAQRLVRGARVQLRSCPYAGTPGRQ